MLQQYDKSASTLKPSHPLDPLTFGEIDAAFAAALTRLRA